MYRVGFLDYLGWRALVNRLTISTSDISTDPATLFRGRVVSNKPPQPEFAGGRWEVLIP